MKNLAYKISLLVVGLFATLSLSAQEISGVVKDSGGQPLVGVSVFVELLHGHDCDSEHGAQLGQS